MCRLAAGSERQRRPANSWEFLRRAFAPGIASQCSLGQAVAGSERLGRLPGFFFVEDAIEGVGREMIKIRQ